MKRAAIAPVVMSPFANERVRQWPTSHYRDLIEIIWRMHRLPVIITGTRAQRALANSLVRGFPSDRVINACGSLCWDDLVAAVDSAAYVVANNSGVAHLAAMRGRWTLCIFSASHAYNEWMPRGEHVVVVTRPLPCSPCDLGTELCPNDVACMTDLQPDEVFWRFHEVYSDAVAASGQRIERA
jgi:ADP-heptose:LPS heptosyltransferase